MANPVTTTYIVRSEDEGRRADQIVAGAYPEISRTLWAKLFDAEGVKLQSNAIRRNAKLKKGDVLEFVIPDLTKAEIQPVAMDLGIQYEDEHLLVLSKQAGVVVHGGAGEVGSTLVSGLLHHCGDKLSHVGGEDRRGIVHRLDRETSGLMVVAKSDEVHLLLSEGFASREILKEYVALIYGVPDLLAGSWRGAIGRHEVHRHKMQVRQDGREARTDWQREQHWGKLASRVRCRIHTGRTHQIRAHWSDAGYPLLGDGTYGFSVHKWTADIEIPRVMLHAARLGFHHPVTKQWMEWVTEIPEDMQQVEKKLNTRQESVGN